MRELQDSDSDLDEQRPKARVTVTADRQSLYDAIRAQIPGVALALDGTMSAGQPPIYATVRAAWLNWTSTKSATKSTRTFEFFEALVCSPIRQRWASNGESGVVPLTDDDEAGVIESDDTGPLDPADADKITQLCSSELYPLLNRGVGAADLATGPGRVLLTYIAVANYTGVTVDEASDHVLSRNIIRAPSAHEHVWALYMDVAKDVETVDGFAAFEISHRVPISDLPDYLGMSRPRIVRRGTRDKVQLVHPDTTSTIPLSTQHTAIESNRSRSSTQPPPTKIRRVTRSSAKAKLSTV
jgi:hypothetical protein